MIEGLPKEKGAMVKSIKREKRSKKKKVGREKEMERMKRETMTHKEVKGSLFIPLSASPFERMIFIKIKRPLIPPFLSQRLKILDRIDLTETIGFLNRFSFVSSRPSADRVAQ